MFFPNADVLYSRFYKDGKVLRVAKIKKIEGVVFALYPTDNEDEFSAEAFREIDDNSPRRIVCKEEIKDNVWLALLSGESREEILKRYHSFGGLPSYLPKNKSQDDLTSYKTFEITEHQEEDILKKFDSKSP